MSDRPANYMFDVSDDELSEKPGPFRNGLTALEPSILRDYIMSIQSSANYFGICANMSDLRGILDSQVLVDPIRHYALQNFVYVASRLSKTQVVDLLEDARLPWGEQSVRNTVSDWENVNNDTIEYSHRDRQVDFLNICWTNEFNVCGVKHEIPGVQFSREEHVSCYGQVIQMCTWGDCLVLVEHAYKPSKIFIQRDERTVMQISQPLGHIISFKVITCMQVHGDLVYVGTREAHVFVFDLRTGALQSNLHHHTDSAMTTLSISKEGDLLWVGHERGNVTAWRGFTAWSGGGTHLGVGIQSSDHVALQAWKDGVAFSVCDGETCIQVWDASVGNVQNIHTIDLPEASREGRALAMHNETMLCVADNRGDIHAYALGPAWTHLWTLHSSTPPYPPYKCDCLFSRGELLLYTGHIPLSRDMQLMVVNTDGITEQVLHHTHVIEQLANTKNAVYARGGGGNITVIHA